MGAFWNDLSDASSGRLRFLIVDDLDAYDFPSNLGQWFSFALVRGPTEFEQAVAEVTSQTASGIGWSPIDGYLTDLKLCENDACLDPDHLRIGLHTKGAGFLIALLWALRWPSSPQAIVPFSGKEKQFEDTWRLCRRIAPKFIVLLEEDNLMKGIPHTEVLRHLVRIFRKALLRALSDGPFHVDYRDRQRFLAYRTDSNAQVDPTTRMQVFGPGGRRQFLLGSLLWDRLVETPSGPYIRGEDVWKLLAQALPARDEAESAARQLVDEYWTVFQHPHSRALYREKDRLSGIGADKLPAAPFYPHLLSRMQVTGNDSGEARRILRLSVCFLLTRLERSRYAVNLLERSFEDSRYDTLAQMQRSELSSLYDDGHLAAYAQLQEQLQEFKDFVDVADPIFSGQIEEFERQFHRALDPYPGTWNFEPRLTEDRKVGKALARIGLKPSALLQRNFHRDLSADECRAVVSFAMEEYPAGFKWAPWLEELRMREIDVSFKH